VIWLLSLPIWLYRLVIAPVIGPRCRFLPPCSAYALEALAVHGPIAGLRLTLVRVCRCPPWGGDGYDPVPAAAAGRRLEAGRANGLRKGERRTHA
jgi:uncharacterized protein